jgi:hypothetical protein
LEANLAYSNTLDFETCLLGQRRTSTVVLSFGRASQLQDHVFLEANNVPEAWGDNLCEVGIEEAAKYLESTQPAQGYGTFVIIVVRLLDLLIRP